MHDLASWIQIYRLPTGRRLFAHRGVLQELAEHKKLGDLKEHVESAIAKDKMTMDLEHKWLQAKHETVGPHAMKLDNEIDRTVGALVSLLRAYSDAPMDTPAKAPAAKLLGELFPAGLNGIINLAHEEEVAALEVLLGRMKKDLAAEVKALPVVAPYVEGLASLTAALRAELEKKRKDTISFDVVRAAQDNGHAMLLQTVARILGAFPGGGEEEKKRAALLRPIWRQNEDVRLSRQRRRRPSDVDPDTGDVVDALPAPDLGAEPLPG